MRTSFYKKALENIAIYAKSNTKIRNFLLSHPRLQFSLRKLYNFLYYTELPFDYPLFKRSDYKKFLNKSSSHVGTYYESENIGPLIINMLFSCKRDKNTDPREVHTLQKKLYDLGQYDACNKISDKISLKKIRSKKNFKILIKSYISSCDFTSSKLFDFCFYHIPNHATAGEIARLSESLLELNILGANKKIIDTLLVAKVTDALINIDRKNIIFLPEKCYQYRGVDNIDISSFDRLFEYLESVKGMSTYEIIPLHTFLGPCDFLSNTFSLHSKSSFIPSTKADENIIKVYIPFHQLPFNPVKMKKNSMNMLIATGSGIGNIIKTFHLIKNIKKSNPLINIDILNSFNVNLGKKILMKNENIRNVYNHDHEDKIKQHYDIKFLLSSYGLTDTRFNRVVSSSQLNYRDYLEFLPVTSRTPEHIYNCKLLNDLFTFDSLDTTELINKENKLKYTIKKVGIACGNIDNTARYNLRQWPFFKHLVKLLNSKGVKVLFFGKKGEYIEGCGDDYTDLETEVLFRELQQLDFFVSVDTGLLHLANHLGVKTIGLYGPTSFLKNRPYRYDNDFSITSDTYCSPCQMSTDMYNCTNNVCMSTINPNTVLNIIFNKTKSKNYNDRKNRVPNLHLQYYKSTQVVTTKSNYSYSESKIELLIELELYALILWLHDINQFNIDNDYSLTAYIIATVKTNTNHEVAFEKIIPHYSKKYFIKGIIKSINYFCKHLNDDDNYVLSKLIKCFIISDNNFYHKIENNLKRLQLDSIYIDEILVKEGYEQNSCLVNFLKNINSSKSQAVLYICHNDLSGNLRGGEYSSIEILKKISHSYDTYIIARSKSPDIKLIDIGELSYLAIPRDLFFVISKYIISQSCPDIIAGYGKSFCELIASKKVSHKNILFFPRHFKDILGENNLPYIKGSKTYVPVPSRTCIATMMKSNKVIFNARYPLQVAETAIKDLSNKSYVCLAPVKEINKHHKGSSIGLINPEKGGLELVRSLAKMQPQLDFIVVGASYLSLPSNVTQREWVNQDNGDYSALYENIGILLYPWSNTPFCGHGRVVYEAINLSIPIISNDVIPLREVLPRNFLLPLASPAELWLQKIHEIKSSDKIDFSDLKAYIKKHNNLDRITNIMANNAK